MNFLKLKKKLVEKYRLGNDKLILIILGAILIFVILLPSDDSKKQAVSQRTSEYSINSDDYENKLETRLTELLGKISGVGNLKVMVTTKSTSKKVLVQQGNYNDSNSEEKSDSGSVITSEKSQELSYVYEDSSPYVIQEKAPEIMGVVVACQGGDNKEEISEITECVDALLGIGVHKIKVVKMY